MCIIGNLVQRLANVTDVFYHHIFVCLSYAVYLFIVSAPYTDILTDRFQFVILV